MKDKLINAMERIGGPLILLLVAAIGFVAGLAEASGRYDKWLIENGAAQYDSKTGKLVYTLEKVKNDK